MKSEAKLGGWSLVSPNFSVVYGYFSATFFPSPNLWTSQYLGILSSPSLLGISLLTPSPSIRLRKRPSTTTCINSSNRPVCFRSFSIAAGLNCIDFSVPLFIQPQHTHPVSKLANRNDLYYSGHLGSYTFFTVLMLLALDFSRRSLICIA